MSRLLEALLVASAIALLGVALSDRAITVALEHARYAPIDDTGAP